MRKIGLFGGTFDPPHFGHIHLANSLAKEHHLDEVWWVPTSQNPLKENSQRSSKDRLEMVKLAILDYPHFKVSDIELYNKGPSFAIDTVTKLKEKGSKDDQFFFLMGDDCLQNVTLWKDVLKLFEIAPPLIGAREFSSFPEEMFTTKNLSDILKKGWTKIEKREISSTNLRNHLKSLSLSQLEIPLKVLDYIKLNRLYS